jgi:hypothetical protein
MKPKNIFNGQNADLNNVKEGGTYRHHWASKNLI